MAGTIKADVVITYPTDDGEWAVLKLSRFEAQFLRQALEQTLGPKNGTVHINGDPIRFEDPKAYAE